MSVGNRLQIMSLALLVILAAGPSAAQQKSAPAKAPQKAPAKAAPSAQAAKAPAEKPAQAPASRRDPFQPLIARGSRGGDDEPTNLPPGPAGLLVSRITLQGLVRAPNGMIAVVTNPQRRVYFLREGQQLYNGKVERITMDSVTFREQGKDAFGKPVERQMTRRLYPGAGEQR